MRILMISPSILWPLYGGASVRMFNIIKELSQKGHQIVLITGVRGRHSDLSNNTLRQFCEKLYTYELPPVKNRLFFLLRSFLSAAPYPSLRFQNRQLRQITSDLIKNEKFDLIWVNFLFMADVLLEIPVKNIPVILDQHEADELIWNGYIQRGNVFQKIFSYLNLKKIKLLQKKVFNRIDAVLCVSGAEAEFMKSRVPAGVKIFVAPNGVDADFFCPSADINKQGNIILMTGAMCIIRNIDAAVWFAKNIFPKIKKSVPEAEFWIVGFEPHKKVLKLQEIPGVKVTGAVENIKPYYERAKVYVAPFRFGEGTRLKVLEAMAMRMPIVTTKFGCQGIDIANGRQVLIADNEKEFANKVVDLLGDSNLAQGLADAGRKFVEQKYNWKNIISDIEISIKK